MESVSDNMAAVIFVLVLFGAPVTAWIVSRVFAHKERMAMISRGFIPPPTNGFGTKGMPPPTWAPQPGPMPPPPPNAGKRTPYAPYDDYYYAQTQMRKGVRLTLIGLALLIGLGTIGHGYPGPWLLGGLVPMFVGIAQVINAALSGAPVPFLGNMNAPHQPSNFGPAPPPPPPGGAPPPQAPPGPYAWRPGPTREIERPDK